MKAGRRYDIFPRTFKARLLLALAFLGGLTIVGFSVAYDALTLDFKLFGDVEVTVENRTERQLTIYVQGRSEAIVPVGETVGITTLKIQWRFGGAIVQAVDSDGIIVFRDDLDLDDLRDIDHHIVIEAPAGGLAIGPVQEAGAGGLPGGTDRTRTNHAGLVRAK